ncbi:MAG: hypothetical protein WC227_02200 [Patescibacteria group bacterium]|jgi:hypothetical protein
MKKKFIIILHLFVMTLAYTSPFWLDWRLIIVGLLLYYLQIWIFGGCILTYAQHGRWDETFSGQSIVWLASKFGMKFRMKAVKKFLSVLPPIFIAIAIVYQILFHGSVLVLFNS